MIKVERSGKYKDKTPSSFIYEYKKKCFKCGCKFNFNEEDVKYQDWDWEGYYPFVICPECHKEIRVHFWTKRVKVFDTDITEVEL